MQTKLFFLQYEKPWYLEYPLISELNITEFSTHVIHLTML
jgi:hypothetical protein